MIIFTGIPLILMIVFAFSTIESFSAYTFNISEVSFTANNLQALVDKTFINSLLRSLLYALIATIALRATNRNY